MIKVTEHSAEIADLTKRLAAMTAAEVGFYASVAEAQLEVAALNDAATNAPADTQKAVIAQRNAARAKLKKLQLATPPSGAGSVTAKAFRQRIADLEAQDKANVPSFGGFYQGPGIDTGQAAARAIRQAAEGAKSAAEAATAERLAAESAANAEAL
jgi:hypothetical protein